MENVVECTVFRADIKEWAAFNEIYREVFKSKFPARRAPAKNRLVFNTPAEVECIDVADPETAS